MIKRVCKYCSEEFQARDESLNYCNALHHKYALVEESKKYKNRFKPRKFEPTDDNTFRIKEYQRLRNLYLKVH